METELLMPDGIEKFPGTYPGTISAPMDLPSLIESADLICEGEVVQVLDEGEAQYLLGDEPTSFRKKVARFHVDYLYLGAVASHVLEIGFLQPDFASSMEKLSVDEYVLIFLKRSDGRYQFAHATASKLPVSRRPLPTVEDKASLLERIRKALIRSLNDQSNEQVSAALESLGQTGGKA
jgi:hypothetical protein